MRFFLLAIAALAFGGCASQFAPSASSAPAARYEQQMKSMEDMHRKMMAAKTPAERQALMAEHMKAMQGGMSMMCEMGGDGMEARGGPSAEMIKRCMDMRDMTMKMMMDREMPRAAPR